LAFIALGDDWIGLRGEEMGLAMLFAGALLFTGYITSNGIFRLLNRFDLLSFIQAGCAAALLAACAFLYASGAPFAAYCWAWAIFFAFSSQIPLWAGVYLARKAGIPISLSIGRMGRDQIRTFLTYCWTTWGVATVDALRSNGDSLLVGGAVSVEAAGVYNVAKQLAGVLRKVNTVYASAAFPEISALSAHGEHDGAARVRRRMLWVGALIGGLAVLAALLFGRFVLVTVFGAQFEAAYVPLAILTAAAGAQLISQTLSKYVQVYVSPEKLFYAYVGAIAVFGLAVLPMTSALSITGTAIAQLLFTLALIAFCHVVLRKAPNAG
jgi:O-antigen/teichoic acid export membrane protein